MSEIQKCPNLVRGGGGQPFSKMSETLIGTLSQIFSIFYFDASPYLNSLECFATYIVNTNAKFAFNWANFNIVKMPKPESKINLRLELQHTISFAELWLCKVQTNSLALGNYTHSLLQK